MDRVIAPFPALPLRASLLATLACLALSLPAAAQVIGGTTGDSTRIGPGTLSGPNGPSGSALGYGTQYQSDRLKFHNDWTNAARNGDTAGMARLDHERRMRQIEQQQRSQRRLNQSRGTIGPGADRP